MPRKPRGYWDDDIWIEPPMSIDVHVPEADDDAPVILLPDGQGEYREHRIVEPRRKLGF